MDDPIQEVATRLAKYPRVTHRRTRNAIHIDAPNTDGFDISLHRVSDHWLVVFGAWFHEEFDDAEDALSFLAFGLSDACRLREVTTPFLRRAFVERRNGEDWVMVFEVGTLFWPLAFGPRERVMRNSLLLE